jgi:hypothetical protein
MHDRMDGNAVSKPEQSNIAPGLRRPVFQRHGYALAIVALLVLMYGVYGNTQEVAKQGHSALLWMVKRWRVSDNLSHGWIIPLISLFFLWRRRSELATATGGRSFLGLLTVVGSLLLYWIGARTQLTRLTLVREIRPTGTLGLPG